MARYGIETPAYTVLKRLSNNIEIRKYHPSKWACAITNGSLNESSGSRSNLFGKLFRYISGDNDYGKKIEMTAPVTMDMKNSSNSSFNMQMAFYVPKEFHQNTPFPNGANMCIKDEPETIVAAITYNGRASIETSLALRDMLIEKLGDEAKYFDCSGLTTAGYNAPFDPVQTYEVWLRKK